jgi:universal stress protein A
MAVKRIACCTDFSDNAEAAFVESLELAEKYGAKLAIIHVLPPVVNPLLTDEEFVVPEEPRNTLVLSLEEKMQQEYGSRIGEGVDYEFVVLDGHVSSEILRYLEENDVDLVLLGSYGLSGMGLVFFGSVAKRVAHKAPCSVMIVRRPQAD